MSKSLFIIEQENKQRIEKYWEQHRKIILSQDNNSITSFGPSTFDIQWMPMTNSQKKGNTDLKVGIPVESIECINTNSIVADFDNERKSEKSESNKDKFPDLRHLCSIEQTLEKPGQEQEAEVDWAQYQRSKQRNKNNLVGFDRKNIERTEKFKVLIKEAESCSQSTINKNSSLRNTESDREDKLNKTAYVNQVNACTNNFSLQYIVANENRNKVSPQSNRQISTGKQLNFSPIPKGNKSKCSKSEYLIRMVTSNTMQNPSITLSHEKNQTNIDNNSLEKDFNSQHTAPLTKHTVNQQIQWHSFGLRQSNHKILTIDKILPSNVQSRCSNNRLKTKQRPILYKDRLINSNLTTAREYKSTVLYSDRHQYYKKARKIKIISHQERQIKAQRQIKFDKLTQQYEDQLQKSKKQWNLGLKPEKTDETKDKNLNQATRFTSQNQLDRKNGCCWNIFPQECFDSGVIESRKSNSLGIRLSMNRGTKGVSLAPKQVRRYSINL